MQKHNDAMKTSGHRSFRKNIPLTLFERVRKGCVWEGVGDRTELQILTPTLMAITAFLSRFPGLLNRGPGGPASLGHGPHSSIFSPTPTAQSGVLRAPLCSVLVLSTASYLQLHDFLFSPGLHNCLTPTLFLLASQFRTQFNPSTVKVISWYSSTGCTCYLHRCISYFWQLGRVGGQYTTSLVMSDRSGKSAGFTLKWKPHIFSRSRGKK